MKKNAKTHLLDAMIDQHDTMYCYVTIHPPVSDLPPYAQSALDALAKWQYNAFDGKRVAKWLQTLLLKNATVQVGREYSPCIYITAPRSAPSKKGTDMMIAFSNKVMREGKKLKADETSMELRTHFPKDARMTDSYVIRLWWD